MGKLLNYEIYGKSIDDILNITKNTDEKIHIVSGNPEVLYNSLYNDSIDNNLKRSNSIIIPDGCGVVSLLRLNDYYVKKMAGVELFEKIIESIYEEKSLYFLGATDEVLSLMIEKLKEKYPKVNIVGNHHGYIDIDNCDDILRDINEKKPYALFVAMGSPKQELFISKYMDKLQCELFMGVGGSFDVLSGNIKRAPQYMINMNLEWLYRIIKQPYRIKKIYKNIIFMIIGIRDYLYHIKVIGSEKRGV